MEQVTPEDHERIAAERNAANNKMILAFGSRSKMVLDVQRIQNRYWKSCLSYGREEQLQARALAAKLRQIANAIDHDLKQIPEED